jgi:hypothetical protein
MQKVRGLVFVSVLLFAGSAQAYQLNVHTPSTHLNPQPLPPGMRAKSMDSGSPVLYHRPGGSIADKHKDWLQHQKMTALTPGTSRAVAPTNLNSRLLSRGLHLLR